MLAEEQNFFLALRLPINLPTQKLFPLKFPPTILAPKSSKIMKIRSDHRKLLVLRIFEKCRFRNTNNDIGIAAQYVVADPLLYTKSHNVTQEFSETPTICPEFTKFLNLPH